MALALLLLTLTGDCPQTTCSGRVDLRARVPPEWCSSDPARNANPTLCTEHFVVTDAARSHRCEYNHELSMCRAGPECAPLPPPRRVAPALCDLVLFSKSRRSGSVGGEWCYNAGAPPVAEFSEEARSRCESAYIDPVLPVEGDYPADCSGTCAPCQYWLNAEDGIFYCRVNPAVQLTERDCPRPPS